jgi:hypothetical protein
MCYACLLAGTAAMANLRKVMHHSTQQHVRCTCGDLSDLSINTDPSFAAAAAGATIQVLLFAIMAVEIKRKAPTCHTVLEVVRVSGTSCY